MQTHGLKLLALSNEPVENIYLNNDSLETHTENSLETLLYKHSTTLKLSGNYQVALSILISFRGFSMGFVLG